MIVLDMKSTRPRRGGDAPGAGETGRRLYALASNGSARAEFGRLIEGWADARWQDFSSGAELLKAAPDLKPGAALVFEPVAGTNVVEVVDWLSHNRPDIPVIVVAPSGTVAHAVACLKAGASDFLSGQSVREGAVSALEAAFAPPKSRPTRGMMLRRHWIASRLSQREMQVLHELVSGLSNKAIGVKLGISERTVEVHRSRIMRRMEAESFAQLVRLAAEAGLD